MTGRELLADLQEKLTPEEKEYLASHRVQDILFQETGMCDDPGVARQMCRRLMFDQIAQAIQLTRKCPGVLTSVICLLTYEYMSQNLRGRSGRGCGGCKLTPIMVKNLPRETGKPLVFTLRKGGKGLVYRDLNGDWYDCSYKLKPRSCTRRTTDLQLHTVNPWDNTRVNLAVAVVEACFANNIQDYEDWSVFRSTRAQQRCRASKLRAKDLRSATAKKLQELWKQLSDEDRAFLERLHLDAHLDAIFAAHKDKPTEQKRHGYYQDLIQLLAATILVSKQTPGALTSFIILSATMRLNRLESIHDPQREVSTGFRFGYRDYCTVPTEPGKKLLFCLRYRGTPLLFFGDDHQWYTYIGPARSILVKANLFFHICNLTQRYTLSKQVVNLCYRYGHDEYTTWKEIKKGGCLDYVE